MSTMRLTPYYQRNGIILYHGDCRDVLPRLPRNSAGMLLTDGPYGIGLTSRERKPRRIHADTKFFDLGSHLKPALDVLRYSCRGFIFSSSDIPIKLDPRYHLERLLVSCIKRITWNKLLAGPSRGLIRSQTEDVFHFINGKNIVDKSAKKVINYIETKRVTVKRLNICQKPIALLRNLIQIGSAPGDMILEPFAGSGAVLVAAYLEKRPAIGIEYDLDQCEKAAARFDRIMDDFESLHGIARRRNLLVVG